MDDPVTQSRLIPILHAIAGVALALWLAVVVLWPWLANGQGNNGFLNSIESLCGRYFCHRIESRSLSWGGASLLVCARCTGVIAGYLLGSVAALCGAEKLPLWRVPWALLLIAVMALSWLGGLQGWLQETWHWERVFAGACGGAGGYILISRCVVLAMNWWQQRQLRNLEGATS